MRPVERAAGGGIARAVVLEHRAIAVLDLDARDDAAGASPSSRRARSRPAGNGEAGSRRAASAACRRRDRFGAQRRDRDRKLGGLVLDRVEPMRIGARLFQQAVARAQRPLERGDPARMLGIDREHEPVEKAAALGGGPVEQLIHRRHQPDRRAGGRRRRLAEDTGSRSIRHLRVSAASSPPAARCRCRASRGRARLRHRPRPPRRRRLPRTRTRRASRAAARGRARGTKSPRSGWSCRRRSGRPAPRARADLDLRCVIAAEIREREAADAGGSHWIPTTKVRREETISRTMESAFHAARCRNQCRLALTFRWRSACGIAAESSGGEMPRRKEGQSARHLFDAIERVRQDVARSNSGPMRERIFAPIPDYDPGASQCSEAGHRAQASQPKPDQSRTTTGSRLRPASASARRARPWSPYPGSASASPDRRA